MFQTFFANLFSSISDNFYPAPHSPCFLYLFRIYKTQGFSYVLILCNLMERPYQPPMFRNIQGCSKAISIGLRRKAKQPQQITLPIRRSSVHPIYDDELAERLSLLGALFIINKHMELEINLAQKLVVA